jgi:hypothetical protein
MAAIGRRRSRRAAGHRIQNEQANEPGGDGATDTRLAQFIGERGHVLSPKFENAASIDLPNVGTGNRECISLAASIQSKGVQKM